jgi:hypothetical protein
MPAAPIQPPINDLVPETLDEIKGMRIFERKIPTATEAGCYIPDHSAISVKYSN